MRGLRRNEPSESLVSLEMKAVWTLSSWEKKGGRRDEVLDKRGEMGLKGPGQEPPKHTLD